MYNILIKVNAMQVLFWPHILCFVTLASSQDCICLEEIQSLSSLRNPVVLTHGEDERIFIGEQVGVVWIVNITDNQRLAEPFLNMTELVKTESRTGDERGFLQVRQRVEQEMREDSYR